MELDKWRSALKPGQKNRTYQHFDPPVDVGRESDFKKVCAVVGNISDHRFLPFVKFTKREVRYRKDAKTGKKERTLKERPIMFASHMDAHVYSAFAYEWSFQYEEFLRREDLVSEVIAYRKIPESNPAREGRNKGNIAFAEEVFSRVKKVGDCLVLVADITSFFDSLNHKTLESQVREILGCDRMPDEEFKVLRSLTRYRYVSKDLADRPGRRSEFEDLLKRAKRKADHKRWPIWRAVYDCGRGVIRENRAGVGIPQGSPASGLLANIYLAAFDRDMKCEFAGAFYRRYSDDLVLVLPKQQKDSALKFLCGRLKHYGLSVNLSKVYASSFERSNDGEVSCVSVSDGLGRARSREYLDYLGFLFEGERVLVRGKTLNRAYRKSGVKVDAFYKRQAKDFVHHPHHESRKGKVKHESYLSRSSRGMAPLGERINQQASRLAKRIRSKRVEGRAKLDKAK